MIMSAETTGFSEDGHVRYWVKPEPPSAGSYLHRMMKSSLQRISVTLATKYGRYGYRRITALLNNKTWLEGQSQESGKNLEKGRTEGAQEDSLKGAGYG